MLTTDDLLRLVLEAGVITGFILMLACLLAAVMYFGWLAKRLTHYVYLLVTSYKEKLSSPLEIAVNGFLAICLWTAATYFFLLLFAIMIEV